MSAGFRRSRTWLMTSASCGAPVTVRARRARVPSATSGCRITCSSTSGSSQVPAISSSSIASAGPVEQEGGELVRRRRAHRGARPGVSPTSESSSSRNGDRARESDRPASSGRSPRAAKRRISSDAWPLRRIETSSAVSGDSGEATEGQPRAGAAGSGRSRTTSPAPPRGSSARPSTVTRTPPALPSVTRNPACASRRRVSPRRTSPFNTVRPSASTFAHESSSNSRVRAIGARSGAGADGRRAPATTGAVPLLDDGSRLVRDVDVLERDRHRARRHDSGGRGPIVALRARDESEDEQNPATPATMMLAVPRRPAPEPRARARLLRRCGFLRLAREVRQVGVHLLVGIDADMQGVGADESAGEGGGGKASDTSLSSRAVRRRMEIFVAEEISSSEIPRICRSRRSSSPKPSAGESVIYFPGLESRC